MREPGLLLVHTMIERRGVGECVTKCCIYNQFSVVLILHSIKAYFFTCSYFRILYSVLHLKDSSTSIHVKFDDLHSIHTLNQLHDSERLHSSKTLAKSSVFRSRDEFSRHNEAIISNTLPALIDTGQSTTKRIK